MRAYPVFNQLLLSTCLLFVAASVGHASIITATYQVTAGDFTDSNNNPPTAATSTLISGTVTFTFDTEIPMQNEINPDTVIGFDITDSKGNLIDHNETNSGVNTSINIFNDMGHFTYGGDVSSVAYMVGLSNDFRVQWDIDLSTFEVTAVTENFKFITTNDPFYGAGYTTVELINVSAVPIGPAAPFFLLGLSMLGMVASRRKITT